MASECPREAPGHEELWQSSLLTSGSQQETGSLEESLLPLPLFPAPSGIMNEKGTAQVSQPPSPSLERCMSFNHSQASGQLQSWAPFLSTGEQSQTTR